MPAASRRRPIFPSSGSSPSGSRAAMRAIDGLSEPLRRSPRRRPPRPAVGAHRHRHRHRLQHRPAVFDRVRRPVARAHRALRLGRRLPRRDRRAARRAARVDARAIRPSRSRRAPMSTPGRCRSASTRGTPASAGSARTPASSIPGSDRGSFSARSSAACRSQPDAPALDQCGTCTLCLEACPTQALVAPGVLDSTRCISYLTIEHRGAIVRALAAGIGSHVYGCDICQEVCPWNAAAPTSDDPAWQPRPAWDRPSAGGSRPDAGGSLQCGARGSAMERAKSAGLRRNIRIAEQNASRDRT